MRTRAHALSHAWAQMWGLLVSSEFGVDNDSAVNTIQRKKSEILSKIRDLAHDERAETQAHAAVLKPAHRPVECPLRYPFCC